MNRRSLVTTAVAVTLAAMGTPAAHAATDIFMIVPGIPGESVQRFYEHTIDVFALRQSLLPTSKGADACAIEVLKVLDIAGPPLWAAAVTGQRFSEIRIDVLKIGEPAIKIYEIRLGDAHIANITTGGEDTFTETVTLGASSMTLTYFPQNKDGSRGTGVSTTVSCK